MVDGPFEVVFEFNELNLLSFWPHPCIFNNWRPGESLIVDVKFFGLLYISGLLLMFTGCQSSSIQNLYSSNVSSASGASGTIANSTLICDITKYGAKGNSTTLNTTYIQAAINDCAAKGGGTVLVPVDAYGGVFISGTVTLKSHLTLSVASGAKIKGSLNDNDYPTVISDWNNNQVRYGCQKALVYADKVTDVTIEGGGTIDGSGDENPNWRNLTATSPDLSGTRRPMGVFLAESSNVTVQNITILGAGFWTLVNLENDGVHIDNVTINSNDPAAFQRDGMDVVDSKNVLIENSTVNSEDDSICLKTGLPPSDSKSGVANVTVKNSKVLGSYAANGLKLGTATTASFNNILFENITVANVAQAAMAVESVDGGAISQITYQNIQVTKNGALAYIILGARETAIGTINGVYFNNITASKFTRQWGSAISGSIINGKAYEPEHIIFDNVHVTALGGLSSIPAAPAEFPYDTSQYPDPHNWWDLPTFGYYIRHVNNIQFKDCTTTVSPRDARPAFDVTSDVTGVGF